MAFLTEGWVSVHLDARRDGVSVPPELAGSPHLVLQYGRNMPIPIPDLEVSDEGVGATLSFSRNPHRTYVPWSAVYIVACTDGRGVLYFEDVPDEVSLLPQPAPSEGAALPGAAPSQARDAEVPGAEAPVGDLRERRKRMLRAVPAGPEEASPESDEPPASPRRRRRPQLKIVK